MNNSDFWPFQVCHFKIVGAGIISCSMYLYTIIRGHCNRKCRWHIHLGRPHTIEKSYRPWFSVSMANIPPRAWSSEACSFDKPLTYCKLPRPRPVVVYLPYTPRDHGLYNYYLDASIWWYRMQILIHWLEPSSCFQANPTYGLLYHKPIMETMRRWLNIMMQTVRWTMKNRQTGHKCNTTCNTISKRNSDARLLWCVHVRFETITALLECCSQ